MECDSGVKENGGVSPCACVEGGVVGVKVEEGRRSAVREAQSLDRIPAC